MTGRSPRRSRLRGTIDELPSGALRVRVHAGTDPVSKRRMDLTEIVPAGPGAARKAEQVRTRLLNEVDEKRNPRSRASVGQLLDKWLPMIDIDDSTRRGYEAKIRKHIRPLIGTIPLTRLDVETLDSLYSELRRCREHCDGRPQIQHRTASPHRCDEHADAHCAPPNPESCKTCRRACKPHVCNGLADSSVRQIHWIISGALDRAVVWGWISVNPAGHADKPAAPHPDPQPPSADEAARLVDAAWSTNPDWGAFVWTKMTTGLRRGEICGLRWHHLKLDDNESVATIRRTVYVDETGTICEKDTKTHQQRRVVLDQETAAVLVEHRGRARERAASAGYELATDAFVFSPMPDGSVPTIPDTATQRYKRAAERLGINTTLKNLRHYSATELIGAGVDVRTVAGRLGHGGGGATTLRVYTAWTSEADQRAASTITGRMPARRRATDTAEPSESRADPEPDVSRSQPYQRIAADLRGAIQSGILTPGDPLPTEKALAERYGVAPSTAHRGVSILIAEGLVSVSRGHRAVVIDPTETR